jgi:hypothetical protein
VPYGPRTVDGDRDVDTEAVRRACPKLHQIELRPVDADIFEQRDQAAHSSLAPDREHVRPL